MNKESLMSNGVKGSDKSTNSTVERNRMYPYLTAVAVGTAIWGYFITKRINRMLINRYGSVVYQIRRVESLQNRYKAFKYLALGGSVMPATVLGAVYLGSTRAGEAENAVTGEATAISRASSKGIYSYTVKASRNLETIAEGARTTLIPSGLSCMGADLRKDINALKRWIGGLF